MSYRLPPLNALRAFEASARHLSFKRAADELCVTAGAVSQQVKSLEATMGVKLFRRLPRGLLLTATGETYLPSISRAFHAISEATEDGATWAKTHGRSTASLRNVAEKVWAGGGALDVQIVGESDDHLDFNVTGCRYAEFYKQLGHPEIGYHIHCKRDFAMVGGFNSELELSRDQTIMQGAPCCDFRFRKAAP